MKSSFPVHICCLIVLLFRIEGAHCHGNHRHHSNIPSTKETDASHNKDIKTVNHDEEISISDHRFFITKLFAKYGHNGIMTFEGFEHLLENLQLGGIIINDHDLSSHKEDDGFRNNHVHHEHRPSSIDQFEVETPPSVKKSTVHDDHVHPHAVHQHHENKNDDDSSHNDDHDDDHLHEDQYLDHKNDESKENPQNNSGAGIWHYKPEYPDNLTSLFQQHHEYANMDDNIIFAREQDCLSASDILKTFNIKNKIDPMGFLHLCPAIIYELDQRHCIDVVSYYKTSAYEDTSQSDVWLYSSIAVIIISLCGLLSVAVIPIMQKVFYQTLIQFLVGLAIGSLSGDALLHLLPHALTISSDHDHSEAASREEEAMVWKGLVALGGIYGFFLSERLLNSITSYRQKKKKEKKSRIPKIVLQTDNNDYHKSNIGQKLSEYRRSSYRNSSEDKEMLQMLNETSNEKDFEKLSPSTTYNQIVQIDSPSAYNQNSEKPPNMETILYHPEGGDDNYVIHISDQNHGHGHGHSHKVPSSMSAVAAMVIMGDGLHNFCDGLAIGAAFAAGISGGFSTAVAVFCHELPHELGDFAMLLKTGMSAKQALLYNGLSSVLCFIGMAIGVALGNVTSATKWVFAGTAGMFIYIALVDMLPELDNTSKNSCRRLAIQFLGISLGISIMLLIAIYEHDMKHMMS